MDQQQLANEIRPGEDMSDVLKRQMEELGATSYWEAVALNEARHHSNEQFRGFWRGVFGL